MGGQHNQSQRSGKLKITLAQRRVLLDRIRREVETVVEDLAGTGETLRLIDQTGRPTASADAEALVRSEQRRLQSELQRLWDEYATLEYRGGAARVAQAA